MCFIIANDCLLFVHTETSCCFMQQEVLVDPKIILSKVTIMKVDVLSVVIFLFCLGVCVTLLDVGTLVSFAEAGVESPSE